MKSIFQFTPQTWKNYSKEILGQDAPITNDNEVKVVQAKVSKWIDEGKNTSQIASMWNAGEGRPDAYRQNWKGMHTNPDGTQVPYDTPTYAKKVVEFAKKFYQEKLSQSTKNNTVGDSGATQPSVQTDSQPVQQTPPQPKDQNAVPQSAPIPQAQPITSNPVDTGLYGKLKKTTSTSA